MISTAPRLRGDLAVRRHQTAQDAFYVVKDPISGEFYRLREAERFVAQQLDGETSLDVVRERTEERFGATLPAGALNAFIKTLERAGLLESTKKRRTGRRRRIRGSPLYLRLALLDPDQLLSRLVPRARLFFTPHFLALSAALVLLAAGITIGSWSVLAQDLSGLWRLSAIPLVLLVAFVVASAHEFAHGMTCKHLGGEVHEMGFMLIYFYPALYCDVSDAWMFPERWKRLWVGLAGPYFELFLWALAVLAWRLTDAGTWVNILALTVIAVSGVKTLLNFNPFIKLDGYYLLSDYLEIPNLRSRSFQYVGSLVGRLFGGGPRTEEAIPRRERRIYLSYGLVATVTSFGLLAYVVLTTGGFLVESHQPGPLLLLAGVVGLRSRRKLRKLFVRPSDPSDEGDADEEDADDDHDRPADASSPEPGRPTRRSRVPWKRWLRWTAATAATLGVLFLGKIELRITGPLNVLPKENADVRTAVEGIVETIQVDEGDTVKAGSVIARLSNETLVAELSKAEAEMRETRAELQKLESGATAGQIELAEAGVSKAADRHKYAQSRLARIRPLLEQGLVSERDFEDLQEQAATAEHELAEARSRLDLMVRGARPEEREATRARLDRLKTQQSYLDEQVRHLSIQSPVTGIVATPSRQLKEMQRQFVGKGTLIAKVYDFETVTAQILISEKDIADVSEGQRVVLRVRAYPDRAFHGTVTSIATSALPGTSASPGGQTAATTTSSGSGSGAAKMLVVTTQIANDSLLLKPEMTGQAKVLCGPRRVVDLITRRLARTFKVEFWSWW